MNLRLGVLELGIGKQYGQSKLPVEATVAGWVYCRKLSWIEQNKQS